MPIVTLTAALMTLVGVGGCIAVLSIPAWRPRGPRRRRAVWRLVLFLGCLVIGIAVLASVASGPTIVID